MKLTTWNAYDGLEGVKIARQYDVLSPQNLNQWMIPYLPEKGNILDIGSGSGRDAKWYAELGLDVTCVEPSASMRDHIKSKFKNNQKVEVLNDYLPNVSKIKRLKKKFDAISIMAVWMHVHTYDRLAAMTNLTRMLNDDGVIFLTLRHGPIPEGRIMYEVSVDEVYKIAKNVGLSVIHSQSDNSDLLNRNTVHWTQIVLKK